MKSGAVEKSRRLNNGGRDLMRKELYRVAKCERRCAKFIFAYFAFFDIKLGFFFLFGRFKDLRSK